MTDPIVPAASPAPVATTERAGRGITIAGVVFAFLIPLLGLILSIVGLVQARAAGQKNGLAIAGIIISIVWPIVLGVVIAAIVAATGAGTCTITVNGEVTAC